MNTSKIIKGVVGGGRYTVTAPIIKEDYGLYLKIEGLELPSTYEVDFSNEEHSGTSVTMIGNSDGVLIPSQFIKSGKDVFAFLYHVGDNYGRTVFKFRIPNKLRPDRTDEEPTPEEQSVIDQTISALNDAVDRAEDAEQAIENMSVSAQTLAEGSSATVTKTESGGVVHLDFGIPVGATGAQGERGEKGEKGDRGEQGIQGIQGERGLTGAKGDKGDKGDKGETGATGAKGEQGERGPQGIQGERGPQGPQGDDYILTEQDKQDIAELVDAGGMVVTATLIYSTMYSVDKTYAEITQAVTDGKNVVILSDGKVYPYAGMMYFQSAPVIAFGSFFAYDGTLVSDGFIVAMDGDDTLAQKIQSESTIPTVNVDDVQINGTSIVSNGVANVPIASANELGVLRVNATYGTMMKASGNSAFLATSNAGENHCKTGTQEYKPIVPNTQHFATFYGLAKAAGHDEKNSTLPVGNYTEDAKSAISEMLGGSVSVSGTTPTIVAKSGIRYVCGEVATLDFTPSATGICDVVFTSGSTPTVVTLPSTVKFPDGAFSAESDTTYEINILDGIYGAVMAWT